MIHGHLLRDHAFAPRMLLAMTLAAAVAPPVASPVSLEWQAPAHCPTAAAVAAITHGLLRERRPDLAPPPLHARAVVTRRAADFSVALELHSDGGLLRRTLTAPDCQLLARGVALLVAVHLDAIAVSRALDPAPTTSSTSAAPVTQRPGGAVVSAGPPPSAPLTAAPVHDPDPPDLSRRPLSQPVPETSFAGHLRLDAGLDAGILPGLGGNATLVGGVGAARWRIDLGLVGTPRRVHTGGAVIGRFDRLGGLARGCAVWRVPPRQGLLALLGCLGAEFGAIHATTDAARPRPDWTPWAAALFGGAARLRLVGPLGLWLGTEAVIALPKPTRYTVADTTLYDTRRAGVRLNFGLDLQFTARDRRR